MNSTFLGLDLKDAAKAVVVAFLSSALTALLTALQAGALPTGAEWKSIAIVGATSALAYIVKNLLTNSDGQMFTKEK